jgi:hypothetical protein
MLSGRCCARVRWRKRSLPPWMAVRCLGGCYLPRKQVRIRAQTASYSMSSTLHRTSTSSTSLRAGAQYGRTEVHAGIARHVPAAANLSKNGLVRDQPLDEASNMQIEAATRSGRRLSHASRTLCVKTLTLVSDMHLDTTAAAAMELEEAALTQQSSGRIKVTFKSDVPVESSAGALLTFLDGGAGQQLLCSHAFESLSSCRHDTWGLSPSLYDVVKSSVSESEQLQVNILSVSLSNLIVSLLCVCSTFLVDRLCCAGQGARRCS